MNKCLWFLLVLAGVPWTACSVRTGVFEKDIAIPDHKWQSTFTPEIIFSVTDTSSRYDIYLVIRHTDAYHYNNIWVRATVREPGEASGRSQQFDLTLSNNNKGWLGSAMDDIYEHRALIQPQTRFKKLGEYHFQLGQVMREDPLLNILNAGIRIEKIQ